MIRSVDLYFVVFVTFCFLSTVVVAPCLVSPVCNGLCSSPVSCSVSTNQVLIVICAHLCPVSLCVFKPPISFCSLSDDSLMFDVIPAYVDY